MIGQFVCIYIKIVGMAWVYLQTCWMSNDKYYWNSLRLTVLIKEFYLCGQAKCLHINSINGRSDISGIWGIVKASIQ